MARKSPGTEIRDAIAAAFRKYRREHGKDAIYETLEEIMTSMDLQKVRVPGICRLIEAASAGESKSDVTVTKHTSGPGIFLPEETTKDVARKDH